VNKHAKAIANPPGHTFGFLLIGFIPDFLLRNACVKRKQQQYKQ
jgi:hypothetical protein